jgi:hypothetical protein
MMTESFNNGNKITFCPVHSTVHVDVVTPLHHGPAYALTLKLQNIDMKPCMNCTLYFSIIYNSVNTSSTSCSLTLNQSGEEYGHCIR